MFRKNSNNSNPFDIYHDVENAPLDLVQDTSQSDPWGNAEPTNPDVKEDSNPPTVEEPVQSILNVIFDGSEETAEIPESDKTEMIDFGMCALLEKLAILEKRLTANESALEKIETTLLDFMHEQLDRQEKQLEINLTAINRAEMLLIKFVNEWMNQIIKQHSEQPKETNPTTLSDQRKRKHKTLFTWQPLEQPTQNPVNIIKKPKNNFQIFKPYTREPRNAQEAQMFHFRYQGGF